MDVTLNAKEQDLLREYKRLFNKPPEWAYPFAPPIPFVGAGYGLGRPKVLIYASAENLTYTRKPKGDRPWLLPDNQMIRARVYNSCQGGTYVHIQPINNGSLLQAARHSLEQVNYHGVFNTDTPEAFLEQVAVANPGKFSKFSVEAKINRDYAGDGTPWLASKPYIGIDLEVLDPDIIIIPRTIRDTLKKPPVSLDLTRKGRVIIPNYQITAGTINRLIKPQLKKLQAPKQKSIVEDWPLTGNGKKLDMSVYLQWLDVIASKWIEPSSSLR